jgi:lysyl-tRNA synthetase class II
VQNLQQQQTRSEYQDDSVCYSDFDTCKMIAMGMPPPGEWL